jgi:hypothetical protein
VWNSRFFDRRDFSELGGVVHLGHGGNPCPCLAHTPPTQSRICISHTNGIHLTNVVYCGCAGSGEAWEQLLRNRIFPSTLSRPYYTFTIAFLKLTHSLTLNTHATTYSLAQTFRRLTNDPFSHKVPVSKALNNTMLLFK